MGRFGVLMRAIIVYGLVLKSCANNSCYNRLNVAQFCTPLFGNAVVNSTRIEATNTCGQKIPQKYCTIKGYRKICEHVCDASVPTQSHPASAVGDLDESTWWQSETLLDRKDDWFIEGQQHVNLTINLGKSYDVTYIRIKFRSPRPASLTLYKKTSEDSDWEPYQYYTYNCDDINTEIAKSREMIGPFCTVEFSDIVPLTGGHVIFSTLEGRTHISENAIIIMDWITVTDLKIVLTEMNTFGDEFTEEPDVLKSYFYAIDNVAIGGRCKCHGHASRCEEGPDGRLVCVCEHNTMGPNCDMCKPFYNNRKWSRGTHKYAMECQACFCNNKSEECYYDDELAFDEFSGGGHCINCRDHRDGPYCERCIPGYYMDHETGECAKCTCHPDGSVSIECDESDSCRCKPGVTGVRCDSCVDPDHVLGSDGCSKRRTVVTSVLKARTRIDDDQEEEKKDKKIEPWRDMIEFSVGEQQPQLKALYSEFLANDDNLTEAEAREKAFADLVPVYEDTIVKAYLHMVQWTEVLKKDVVHRSIKRMAKKLQKNGTEKQRAWEEATKKRIKQVIKNLKEGGPPEIY